MTFKEIKHASKIYNQVQLDKKRKKIMNDILKLINQLEKKGLSNTNRAIWRLHEARIKIGSI
jgi:hypothetical protein